MPVQAGSAAARPGGREDAAYPAGGPPQAGDLPAGQGEGRLQGEIREADQHRLQRKRRIQQRQQPLIPGVFHVSLGAEKF